MRALFHKKVTFHRLLSICKHTLIFRNTAFLRKILFRSTIPANFISSGTYNFGSRRALYIARPSPEVGRSLQIRPCTSPPLPARLHTGRQERSAYSEVTPSRLPPFPFDPYTLTPTPTPQDASVSVAAHPRADTLYSLYSAHNIPDNTTGSVKQSRQKKNIRVHLWWKMYP